MSYLININDAQRLALIEVLGQHNPNRGKNYDPEPLRYWIEMLQELPSVEPTYGTDKAPTMIHGFCL